MQMVFYGMMYFWCWSQPEVLFYTNSSFKTQEIWDLDTLHDMAADKERFSTTVFCWFLDSFFLQLRHFASTKLRE